MSRGTFINTPLPFSERFSNQLHQSEVATMNKSRQQVSGADLCLPFRRHWHMAEHSHEDRGKDTASKCWLPPQKGWGSPEVEELSGDVLLYFSDKTLFFAAERRWQWHLRNCRQFSTTLFCFLMNCWLSPSHGFPFISSLILASV